MTRRLYSHYGVVIRSDARLPGAVEIDGGPVDVDVDVAVCRSGPVPLLDLDWRAIHPEWVWRTSGATGSWLRMRYANARGAAEFVIDPPGRRLWLSVSDGVAIADAAELLLGPVFSCLMSHRGLTCLHASVVRIGDRAIAFAGPSGAGKSTIAAALARRGAQLVSDDVAVLGESGGRAVVASGRASARVLADTAVALRTQVEELRRVWVDDSAGAGAGKRVIDFQDRRSADPRRMHPLGAVVLLEPRSAPGAPSALRRLRPAEALPRLMAGRHMVTILDRCAHGPDMAILARVADRLPAYRLHRPDGLAALDETLDTISRSLCDRRD